MRTSVLISMVIVLGAGLLGCSGSTTEELVSSRAYKGHESDLDITNFVNVYPATLGTRLDDCQTCHTGFTFSYDSGGQTVTTFKNACDYCHLIQNPVEDYIEPMPTSYAQTLNPYGAAYLAAGRDRAGLKAIAGDDSDADGAGNADEIADLKYPGDPDSKPGQQVAPTRTFSMEQLKALPAHSEFLLANSSKQQYDTYASYEGVKVVDLLTATGVDVQDAAFQGITLIAPDGYLKDFTREQIVNQYPDGLFYAGLDTTGLGAECGFVEYPNELPAGLTDGAAIPDEQWLMLAYSREGLPMDPCNLDITSGRINGEGPLRIIVPQDPAGSPDRGSKFSPTTCNDGYDYDDLKDHNAGAMVRGVVAVRVNPLPTGVEDFDARYGGWAFIDDQSVIVYGHGVVVP